MSLLKEASIENLLLLSLVVVVVVMVMVVLLPTVYPRDWIPPVVGSRRSLRRKRCGRAALRGGERMIRYIT